MTASFHVPLAGIVAFGLLAGCGGKPPASAASSKPPPLATIVVQAESAPGFAELVPGERHEIRQAAAGR